MHLTQPNRQVIQAQHLNERKDVDLHLKLKQLGHRNRHETTNNQSKSSEQVSRVHLLVGCLEVREQVLHHQGHV